MDSIAKKRYLSLAFLAVVLNINGAVCEAERLHENYDVVTVHSSTNSINCTVKRADSVNIIKNTIGYIINNATHYKNKTGGQMQYPSLEVEIHDSSNFGKYSFYNVSLNEVGDNYIMMVHRGKSVYGLSRDADPIYEIVRRGKGAGCRVRK